MIHENAPRSETVLVEAGMIADVETGEVRSAWLERHHALLEVRRDGKRAARDRRLRVVRNAWHGAILALSLGAVVLFATHAGARKMAGEAWAGLEMVTGTGKKAEESAPALEQAGRSEALPDRQPTRLSGEADGGFGHATGR